MAIIVSTKYDYTKVKYPVYSDVDMCQADMNLSLKDLLNNFVRTGSRPASLPDSAYDLRQNDDDFETEVSKMFVDPLDAQAYKDDIDSRIAHLKDQLLLEESERMRSTNNDSKKSDEESA